MYCSKCRSEQPMTINGGCCRNCGKHPDRPVLSRSRMRRRNIGGKRGRNSGIVKTNKQKR